MQIEIREFLTFEDLKDKCWSGASFILNEIDELNDDEAADCFMHILEESFETQPDMTELNDFLWFEDKYIIEQMAEYGYEIEK